MKPVLQPTSRLDHIGPSDLASAVDNSGHQDALVQALAARMEALEPVNCRESGLGIVKREQFPVYCAPTVRCNEFGDRSTMWRTLADKLSLRGNVIRGTGRPPGENVLLGDLHQWVAGPIV